MLTGRASFRSWCAACVQGRGRPERHHGEGRKELEDGSKVPVVPWDYCFLGARNRTSEAEVAQRGDCPVLVMHVGVTKSNVAHLIPAKRVHFPSYKKGGEDDRSGLRTLSVTTEMCFGDTEPSILSLLRAVKLAWTGDVTSAESDPPSNGAAESSSVEVPADHDLLTFVPYAAKHAPSVCWPNRLRGVRPHRYLPWMWERKSRSPNKPCIRTVPIPHGHNLVDDHLRPRTTGAGTRSCCSGRQGTER